MIRPIIAAFVIFTTLGLGPVWAQQAVSFKNFASFRQIVPEVDFFASNRQTIEPYEKPVSEAITRLKSLLGSNIPRGAIFVCSTLAQKDSIYEPMVLKKGYGWTLTALTPQVRMQETMERMKSQMGGDLPAEVMERMKSRLPQMMADAEKEAATTIAQNVAYAVIQTTFDKELRYRSSRLDDMGKSPLPDWLDIGIASYVSGNNSSLSYLQQHMDQTFPIEDMIAMSRPFVASQQGGDSGGRGGRGGGGGESGQGMPGGGMPGGMQGGMPGGGMPGGMQGGMQGGGMPGGMQGGMQGGMPQGMSQGGFGGRTGGAGGYSARSGNGGGVSGRSGGGGGFGANGGQRGGQQRVLPKDEQDRMLFDGQASTLFAYLIEKIGIEKVKQLISQAQEGKESREYLARSDVLGSNFSRMEEDWAGWVKALKPPQNQRQGFPGQF